MTPLQELGLAAKILRMFTDPENWKGCGGCYGWSGDSSDPMALAQEALDAVQRVTGDDE